MGTVLRSCALASWMNPGYRLRLGTIACLAPFFPVFSAEGSRMHLWVCSSPAICLLLIDYDMLTYQEAKSVKFKEFGEGPRE